jgi:membrane protein implicated in regulation of membrane protease activity
VIAVTWATFYLICFVVGLAFSVLSLLSSFGLHLPAKFHLLRVGHGGHAGVHPLHAPGHGGPTHFTPRPGAAQRAGATGTHISFFNFASFMAFLAWFGGTGYLLTRYSNFVALMALGLAGASGLAAAAVVFFFLAKVLLAHETQLDPADFDLVGVLGKVNVTIRPGGTGEIVFSQAGARHVAGARSADGKAIQKGTEVVVTRYERGIAYVRTWEELAGERPDSPPVRAT